MEYWVNQFSSLIFSIYEWPTRYHSNKYRALFKRKLELALIHNQAYWILLLLSRDINNICHLKSYLVADHIVCLLLFILKINSSRHGSEESTGQQWRKRHKEWPCGHGERGGEGELYGESMENYSTMCKIDSQRNLLYGLRKLTGALYQPRGVEWEGDWREVQKGGDICIPVADSCWGLTENSKNL